MLNGNGPTESQPPQPPAVRRALFRLPVAAPACYVPCCCPAAAPQVVEKHWFERNRHIFPASRWEVFDPEKVRPAGGALLGAHGAQHKHQAAEMHTVLASELCGVDTMWQLPLLPLPPPYTLHRLVCAVAAQDYGDKYTIKG